MDIYIDLSLLSFMETSILSLWILKNLFVKKIKFRCYIVLSILSVLNIFYLYLELWKCILIYLIPHLFYFVIEFKKDYFKYFILYIFFSISCPLFLFLFFDGIILIQGHLFITSYQGIIVYLAYYLIGVSFGICSYIVDKLYRLHSYKDKVVLMIGRKKYYVSGYYDSGNILLFNDSPVIFMKKKDYPLEIEGFIHQIEANSISGKTNFLAKGVMVSKGDRNKYQFAYLCLDESEGNYHGCELLLNAYLI